MALGLGENVRNLQYFVGQSPWKTEPVLEVHQRMVAETLGEADGVALIDESGVVKQGDCSVGVAAQYCGSVGKIANSQNGVYLGYASRKGYSLIEGQLFMPESWFDEAHEDQREACGVPADLKAKTKPEIGLELLKRAVEREQFALSMGGCRRIVWRFSRFSGWGGCVEQMVLHGNQMFDLDLAVSS